MKFLEELKEIFKVILNKIFTDSFLLIIKFMRNRKYYKYLTNYEPYTILLELSH